MHQSLLWNENAESSADAIAIDLAAKGQNVPGLRTKDDMSALYGAFETSGLVRTFEVPGQLPAILRQFHILGGGHAIVVILRIDCPIASHIRWRLVRGWLLGQNRRNSQRQHPERSQNPPPNLD